MLARSSDVNFEQRPSEIEDRALRIKEVFDIDMRLSRHAIARLSV